MGVNISPLKEVKGKPGRPRVKTHQNNRRNTHLGKKKLSISTQGKG